MSGSGGGGNGRNGGDDWRPTSTISSTAGTASGDASEDDAVGEPNPCMFTEITNLASPNMTVIGTLVIGSVLTIVLQEMPLRVVAMFGGSPAGSITSARLADIIQCLRAGQQYEARVTEINGGAVTVEIYPR